MTLFQRKKKLFHSVPLQVQLNTVSEMVKKDWNEQFLSFFINSNPNTKAFSKNIIDFVLQHNHAKSPPRLHAYTTAQTQQPIIISTSQRKENV